MHPTEQGFWHSFPGWDDEGSERPKRTTSCLRRAPARLRGSRSSPPAIERVCRDAFLLMAWPYFDRLPSAVGAEGSTIVHCDRPRVAHMASRRVGQV